jgi:hypothetical protein
MRLSDPRSYKIGFEGYDQQRPKIVNAIRDLAERFQTAGIGPMCVFENHQRWILSGQGRYLRDERFQRSLPAELRGDSNAG